MANLNCSRSQHYPKNACHFNWINSQIISQIFRRCASCYLVVIELNACRKNQHQEGEKKPIERSKTIREQADNGFCNIFYYHRWTDRLPFAFNWCLFFSPIWPSIWCLLLWFHCLRWITSKLKKELHSILSVGNNSACGKLLVNSMPF